jgi:hypothetical protein
MHLLPDVYESKTNIGICIMLGILFQIILEFFSKGAEHGHTWPRKHVHIPWLLFISLCIHAFSRRFSKPSPRFSGWYCHSSFTIAIILTTFFINSHLHKSYFGFMLTFALMTQLGR